MVGHYFPTQWYGKFLSRQFCQTRYWEIRESLHHSYNSKENTVTKGSVRHFLKEYYWHSFNYSFLCTALPYWIIMWLCFEHLFVQQLFKSEIDLKSIWSLLLISEFYFERFRKIMMGHENSKVKECQNTWNE